MRISKHEAAEMLQKMDNILILAHKNPDGDAVGSSAALCRGLRDIGKTAYIYLESVSKIDLVLTDGLFRPSDFTPEHIVAVDTADIKILASGDMGENINIELCIDHHISNKFFAENTCLDENAAAAAEVIYDIMKLMDIPVTEDIAECVYVGLATDTGCFRYGNTTPKALRTAADLADTGIDLGRINKIQFETKTKEYAAIEQMAIGSMQAYFGGKCMVITVTHDMYEQSGASDSETQPLASIPKQIEGVYVGITLKEKEKGVFRISLRTNEPADASEIAKQLGGGGHKMAAGCSFEGTAQEAVAAVLRAAEIELMTKGLAYEYDRIRNLG